jgi:hypothetical protein
MMRIEVNEYGIQNSTECCLCVFCVSIGFFVDALTVQSTVPQEHDGRYRNVKMEVTRKRAVINKESLSISENL